MSKDLHLIKKAFKHLNDYKRFRAMKETAYTADEVTKMDLNKYKSIDQLELTLRGLQAELRRQAAESGTDGVEEEDDNE